jgi:hypothetical protein
LLFIVAAALYKTQKQEKYNEIGLKTCGNNLKMQTDNAFQQRKDVTV